MVMGKKMRAGMIRKRAIVPVAISAKKPRR